MLDLPKEVLSVVFQLETSQVYLGTALDTHRRLSCHKASLSALYAWLDVRKRPPSFIQNASMCSRCI